MRADASGDEPAGQVRARLEQARSRTRARIAQLRGDHDTFVEASRDTNADDEHDPEGATIAWEREQAGHLLRVATHDLAEVEAALGRLEAGRYGRCERCGDRVARERLEVRPTARTCVSCRA